MRAPALAIVVLAGCGDQLAGDPVPPPPDASPEVVSLRYQVDPPETGANWPVYFQNADGSLVSAQHTGSDGSANAFMDAGGSVTIVTGDPDSARIWTYLAVKPGDQLELDLRHPEATSSVVILTMRIPRLRGAAFYQLFTSCGQANITGAENVPTAVTIPQCDTSTDMLVLARDGNGGIAGSLLQLEVPTIGPDIVTFDGEYQLPTQSTVTAIAIPPSIVNLAATHGTLGRRTFLYSQRLQFALLGQGASLTFTLPQGRTGTILDAADSSTDALLRVADWRDANDHTVIDLGPRLPDRSSADVPTFDALTRTLRWVEQAGTLAPDTVIAGLGFFDDISFVEWQIIAPRSTAPEVRFPVLPDHRFEPHGMPHAYLLIDAAVEGGYDAARELVLGQLPDRPWPMAGPSGHAIYQVTSY